MTMSRPFSNSRSPLGPCRPWLLRFSGMVHFCSESESSFFFILETWSLHLSTSLYTSRFPTPGFPVSTIYNSPSVWALTTSCLPLYPSIRILFQDLFRLTSLLFFFSRISFPACPIQKWDRWRLDAVWVWCFCCLGWVGTHRLLSIGLRFVLRDSFYILSFLDFISPSFFAIWIGFAVCTQKWLLWTGVSYPFH